MNSATGQSGGVLGATDDVYIYRLTLLVILMYYTCGDFLVNLDILRKFVFHSGCVFALCCMSFGCSFSVLENKLSSL